MFCQDGNIDQNNCVYQVGLNYAALIEHQHILRATHAVIERFTF